MRNPSLQVADEASMKARLIRLAASVRVVVDYIAGSYMSVDSVHASMSCPLCDTT